WLAVAGPRRGRHAVGYWLTAGVCIADAATLDPAGGSPDAARGPQCSGHGLAALRCLSVPPRGGADCRGSGGRRGVRLAAAVGPAPQRLASLCRPRTHPVHSLALWSARAHGRSLVVGTLVGWHDRAYGSCRSITQYAACATARARDGTGGRLSPLRLSPLHDT